jgi:endo-1,4-beta-xylanase
MNVAKILLFLSPALLLAQAGRPSPTVTLPLWPPKEAPPEAVVERGNDGVRNAIVSNIHNPSILVYLPPKERSTGTAIIICPGGGHRYLAIDHEGYNIATWLNSIGVAGIILKYRLSHEEGSHYTVDDAANDGRQAIRLVRERAAEWHLDPERIGIMGFSAGGEVAAMAGTTPQDGARPAFMALLYPGLQRAGLKPGPSTPPVFISFASDDSPGIYEPTVKFYLDLRKANVPVEMHVFAKGGHGFGIKPANHGLTATWTLRFEDWMRENGWLKTP